MKIGKNGNAHMIDLLFTLALFCVFAASALMVVLIGARVYQNTVRQMNANFDGRASVAYVTNKIHQNDRADSISLIDLDEGITGLALDYEVDGITYQTVIYHYDGALREIPVEKGDEFPLDSGQAIVQVSSFTITEAADGLFVMETVDREGNAIEMTVASRCG